MTRLLTSLLVGLLVQTARAQAPPDTLYRTDGSREAVRVEEIGESRIRYHRPDDPARQPLRVERREVWKIRFGDGREGFFTNPAAPVREPAPVAVEAPPSSSRLHRAFAGLHVGGVLPELHRGQPNQLAPLSDNRYWIYRVGLTIEAVNTRWYGLRVELGYVRRGGAEVFAAPNGLRIDSRTALHYAQGTLLPLILKAGSPRLRSFVGVGGYAGYLLGFSQSYTFRGGVGSGSEEAFGRYLQKFDYGPVVGAGLYLGRHVILEVRYEAGLPAVYRYPDGRDVRNRAVSVLFHF